MLPLWGPSLQGRCSNLTLCLVGGGCLFYLENIFFLFMEESEVLWAGKNAAAVPCRLLGGEGAGSGCRGSSEPSAFCCPWAEATTEPPGRERLCRLQPGLPAGQALRECVSQRRPWRVQFFAVPQGHRVTWQEVVVLLPDSRGAFPLRRFC